MALPTPEDIVEPPFSLDGIRMHVVTTAGTGVVNADTLFTFAQDGNAVSAEYAGGKVRKGFLVGVLASGELWFRYAQLDIEGHLDGGSSRCEISRGADGRLRLLEHFQWESRDGAGINVFEELPVAP
jgi:hypothetical protein